MRDLTRGFLGGIAAVLFGIVLYAQEPQIFERGIVIIRGNLDLGGAAGNRLCFEGATADASESCFTVTDPTADRLYTFGNADNTLASWTFTTPTINTPILATESMTGAGATETLTSADCGQTVLWDTAAGSVITLPPATGTGCWFRLVVSVSITSGAGSVQVVGNDEFVGGLSSVGTTADQADVFTAADAADTDLVTMNGTTTGGLLGTVVFVQDISTDNWLLYGLVHSSDASATMLSTGQVS